MPASAYELENLAGLLRDFGADGWTPDRAAEAFEAVAVRSLQLESFLGQDAAFVHGVASGTDALPLWRVLDVIGRGAHRFLFEPVLRTAGEVRQGSDPGGGYVEFGGRRGQTVFPKFVGTPPAGIGAALEVCFARLVDARTAADSDDAAVRARARLDATDAAVCFYKDWSGVHPFYDANGRVGRYVVMVYLLLHGRYVRWDTLDGRETRFLKRINECLKRRGHVDARVQARYEGYLVQFWRPFVEDVPDEDPAAD